MLGSLLSSCIDAAEDEASVDICGKHYGPLKHVPRKVNNILNNSTSYSLPPGKVAAYGADYYEFSLAKTVSDLKVKLVGNKLGNFSYHFIGIKNNTPLLYTLKDFTTNNVAFEKLLTSGEWDKLCLIVTGRSIGGSYTIKVGP